MHLELCTATFYHNIEVYSDECVAPVRVVKYARRVGV